MSSSPCTSSTGMPCRCTTSARCCARSVLLLLLLVVVVVLLLLPLLLLLLELLPLPPAGKQCTGSWEWRHALHHKIGEVLHQISAGAGLAAFSACTMVNAHAKHNTTPHFGC